MRLPIVAASLVAALSTTSIAAACDSITRECLPDSIAFPAYTPEGVPVGTVTARVRRGVTFVRSRFTGRPITVVYNGPSSFPGAIDPVIARVPLPRVGPSRTQAVFPKGY